VIRSSGCLQEHRTAITSTPMSWCEEPLFHRGASDVETTMHHSVLCNMFAKPSSTAPSSCVKSFTVAINCVSVACSPPLLTSASKSSGRTLGPGENVYGTESFRKKSGIVFCRRGERKSVAAVGDFIVGGRGEPIAGDGRIGVGVLLSSADEECNGSYIVDIRVRCCMFRASKLP